ncbi:coiled-coil domain-containing protein 167-like [Ylistrum balloti]|uniref:coiled-coil domain-containing protein 167-like n=1 Tax=Ylistrum balloti TaxID=509963 RepID=UPI002905D9E0|nr:coiled-coil domain-containing protein 167-like [Ylistrum balloti]
MATVATQIAAVEAEIQGCEERLDVIERSLRLRDDLNDSDRKELKEEAKRVNKTLTNHKSELKQLRKENWKNMLLSVLLMGLVYLTYHYIWAP